MATSSALPVAWTAPPLMRLSTVPSETPRPTWAALVPPTPAPEAEPVLNVCCSASLNVVRAPLKPTVLTLARSLAATSSITCCVLRPEMAENMPRIISASPSLGFLPASSRRSSRFECEWRVRRQANSRDDGRSPSSDDGRVDVGEHVLAHGLRVDRRDDGLVADGDDECRPVDQHHGLPRALGGRALHGPVEAGERLGRGVDVAALHPLERVAGELHAGRAVQRGGERTAGLRRGRMPGRNRRRRADGRDQSRVERLGAHRTSDSAVSSTPAWPSTVSVGPLGPMLTFSTVPAAGTPLLE